MPTARDVALIGAFEQRFYTGNEFDGAERFGRIIVGADAQPDGFVSIFGKVGGIK